MKLIVEITRMDDKVEKHECNDFPATGDFLTLYKEGFKRESIRMASIASYKTYFKK